MVKVGFPKMIPGISDVYLGSFDRSAAGDHAVTGVGFVPKIVIFFAHGTGGTHQIFSKGVDDGVSPRCIYFKGDVVDLTRSVLKSIWVQIDGDNHIEGAIKSLDADGFTITWTLTGVATAYTFYLAMK